MGKYKRVGRGWKGGKEKKDGEGHFVEDGGRGKRRSQYRVMWELRREEGRERRKAKASDWRDTRKRRSER